MKVAFGRNIDIIAESADIKEALYLRFYELNLSNTAVCRDARNKGHRIYESSLSRYLSTLKKKQAEGGCISLCLSMRAGAEGCHRKMCYGCVQDIALRYVLT